MGKQTKTSMEITCKDIRHNRRIRLEDLVNKIRAELGEENCYRLVCCGKVMREYDPLVSYCSLTVLPVIVMVTTPQEADKYDQQVRQVEDCQSPASQGRSQRLCYDSGFDSE